MNKTLNFVKEYLAIILIIPTFIGGLYQLLNIIYYVGFPYVRFYSVTQVVPDGFLIGILILFFSLSYYFVTSVVKFFTMSIYSLGGENSKKILLIIFLLMIPLAIWRSVSFETESVIGFSIIDFFWDNVIFTSISISLILCCNLFANFTLNFMKVLYWLIFTLYLIIFTSTLATQIKKLNNNIINDYMFYNPNTLINRMIEKDPSMQIKLLYANRDYLFFEAVKNGSKKIIVEDAKKLTSLDDNKEEEKNKPCKANINVVK